MSSVNAGESGHNGSGAFVPTPIASNYPIWLIIIGAFFGFITLMGLFIFAYLSSTNKQLCSSFQFQLLAGGFALGAALAGGFIGGGAGAQGKADGAGFSVIFGLTGGAALLIVTLTVFSIFAPKGCELVKYEQTQIDFEKMKTDLSKTQADLENARSALATLTSERNAAISANTTARAAIRGLIAGIQNAFPDAGNLSNSVSRITNLVTQSCSGGPHGTDPDHADEIRSISLDASRRISSAQTAITSIVTSVPAELRN